MTVAFETERILAGWIFDIEHIMGQWVYYLGIAWNVSNSSDSSIFDIDLGYYDALTTDLNTDDTGNDGKSSDYLLLQEYYNYALVGVIGFFLFLTIGGKVDATFIHENEQFRWFKIIIVGLYTMDVVSGMFVCIFISLYLCIFCLCFVCHKKKRRGVFPQTPCAFACTDCTLHSTPNNVGLF